MDKVFVLGTLNTYPTTTQRLCDVMLTYSLGAAADRVLEKRLLGEASGGWSRSLSRAAGAGPSPWAARGRERSDVRGCHGPA